MGMPGKRLSKQNSLHVVAQNLRDASACRGSLPWLLHRFPIFFFFNLKQQQQKHHPMYQEGASSVPRQDTRPGVRLHPSKGGAWGSRSMFLSPPRFSLSLALPLSLNSILKYSKTFLKIIFFPSTPVYISQSRVESMGLVPSRAELNLNCATYWLGNFGQVIHLL